MRRSRLRALALAVVLAATPIAAAEDRTGPGAAGAVALLHIAALRAHDFAAAYALASVEMRRTFSRGEFEWMVKRAHPEVADSSFASVVRTHESGGYVYVTVKVVGRNGEAVEALYEMVDEGGSWRVNALSSREDDGLI